MYNISTDITFFSFIDVNVYIIFTKSITTVESI